MKQSIKQGHVTGALRGKTRATKTTGFAFTSDWLRKWHEFFKPITERCKAKPKQMQLN